MLNWSKLGGGYIKDVIQGQTSSDFTFPGFCVLKNTSEIKTFPRPQHLVKLNRLWTIHQGYNKLTEVA